MSLVPLFFYYNIGLQCEKLARADPKGSIGPMLGDIPLMPIYSNSVLHYNACASALFANELRGGESCSERPTCVASYLKENLC